MAQLLWRILRLACAAQRRPLDQDNKYGQMNTRILHEDFRAAALDSRLAWFNPPRRCRLETRHGCSGGVLA